jgi:NADH dehydrogenase (ubiquinone) 1 alpha subcomplex subunit 13
VLKEEKLAARKAIAPVLQAEEDRRYVQTVLAAREQEAKVMANVPGWVPGQSQYSSGRWTPPAMTLRPSAATS